MGIIESFAGLAVVLVLAAVIAFVGIRLYTLAPKEKSFIRTGVGGEKVVMNGGAFVIPGIHKVLWVNMKTLRLEVLRKDKDSLITKDSMRVDVKAEFFVRVKAEGASIATAGQTLGELTLKAEDLRTQVEAKFVDALRSVASGMSMTDLHQKRQAFVQAVQASVAEDLTKNGLELESVSLTSLNQTDASHFDPNNAFDAEGLAQLTRQTEGRRKDINDTKQETRVAIAKKDLQTTEQTLELKRAQSAAELNNAQEIAQLTAKQEAEIARAEAEGQQAAETARLASQQEINQKRISTAQAVETAEVEKNARVQVALQEQAILVANKSADEARAQATAAEARAHAAKAEEQVVTARQVEIASRDKAVALVRAEQEASEKSIGVKVAAEAEQAAATALAAAVRIRAEGALDAALLQAQAIEAEGAAVAKALREKNEAQNTLSVGIIEQQVKMQVLSVLPALVTASVEPLKSVDSIRIAAVDGLNGVGGAAQGGSGEGSGQRSDSLAEQLTNAALKVRVAGPMVDNLLGSVGLASGGDMGKLIDSAANLATTVLPTAVPAASVPAEAN